VSSSKLEVAIEGECFTVIMTESVIKALEKLDDRKRTRLIVQMEKFADHGTQFNGLKREGRHPLNDGSGQNTQIFAFGDASTQCRIYGGYTHELMEKSFTCVSLIEKKKQSANQTDLQQAAKQLGIILKNGKDTNK